MDYRRALLSSPEERIHRRPRLPRLADVIYGAVACVAVGGPLLGLMGFTLLGSAALLLVASPLLLFFSPLLLFAASVVVVAFVGFGAAGVIAGAGVWALKRASSFLIRQHKGGADAAAVHGDGWEATSSSAPHEIELGSGAGGGDSSEPKHLEGMEDKAKAMGHVSSENGIQDVEVK